MAISDELRKLVDPNNECCCEHCLSNKCKEWASKHHYSVMSGWEMTHWGGAYRVAVFRNSDNILFSMSTVKTEPEAIFKACQWILDKDSK